MNYYLLLDANIFLDAIENEDEIEIIEEWLNKENIFLLLPNLILEEWNRNKDQKAIEFGKKLGNQKKHLKHFKKAIDKAVNVNLAIDTFHAKNLLNLQRLDKIIERGIVLQSNDEIKIEVGTLAEERKAPFHLTKNLMLI